MRQIIFYSNAINKYIKNLQVNDFYNLSKFNIHKIIFYCRYLENKNYNIYSTYILQGNYGYSVLINSNNVIMFN